jgi:phosphatidylcholine synthase
VIVAWLVHLYTASGAFFSFLALIRVFESRYREAFIWLFVTVVVDATDGVFARLADVTRHTPSFNGGKLDDVVDYLAYVVVPAFVVWHARLVPDALLLPAAGAMLVSSAYGFNRMDAKTADYYFTGFPSYWNIVAFYLYVAGWPLSVNAGILFALAALVFVPIRYVYPSRTPAWRAPTVAFGILWGVIVAAIVWQLPQVSRALVIVSLAFPIYYFALSLALELTRASR